MTTERLVLTDSAIAMPDVTVAGYAHPTYYEPGGGSIDDGDGGYFVAAARDGSLWRGETRVQAAHVASMAPLRDLAPVRVSLVRFRHDGPDCVPCAIVPVTDADGYVQLSHDPNAPSFGGGQWWGFLPVNPIGPNARVTLPILLKLGDDVQVLLDTADPLHGDIAALAKRTRRAVKRYRGLDLDAYRQTVADERAYQWRDRPPTREEIEAHCARTDSDGQWAYRGEDTPGVARILRIFLTTDTRTLGWIDSVSRWEYGHEGEVPLPAGTYRPLSTKTLGVMKWPGSAAAQGTDDAE